jgi:isopenicillin N synthase-like dioxygenase
MNKNELDSLPSAGKDAVPVEDDPSSKYAILKAPNVLPEAFPDWKQKMEKWGNQMLTAVDDVNGMLAVGLGLEENSLKNLAK